MQLTYPTISKDKDNNLFITFYLNQKRYRLYSSKKIGGNNHPNHFEGEEKTRRGQILSAEVYSHFKKGGKFLIKNQKKYATHKDLLKAALEKKISSNYSHHYICFLNHVYTRITQDLGAKNLSSDRLNLFLSSYSNPSSFNSVKKHLNALLEGAYVLGLRPKIDYDKKSRKTKAKLHKPFPNVSQVLMSIKEYNSKLYLCCLLTYGCLLRPHREIRELRWKDFSNDLGQINLSGYQNKSAKNRIVPIPKYIRQELMPTNLYDNIFSNRDIAYNKDYFKSLWRNFKMQSDIIKENQTLYSFRHSGAIELYKRTGSIEKLQKAMGHSSLRVSLTYLRGLEVAELVEEDMPQL